MSSHLILRKARLYYEIQAYLPSTVHNLSELLSIILTLTLLCLH